MVKEVLTMSHQELDRFEVLKLIEEKQINQIQGAKQLFFLNGFIEKLKIRLI